MSFLFIYRTTTECHFCLFIEPALIPKSSIVLDVKPWDDETDMKELERNVRTIVKDGLVWGQCKLIFHNI